MIPAEAVEAAAQALRDAFDWGVDGFEEQAKRALEAAAPHCLRPVWDEAYGKGFEAGRGEVDTPNPYEVEA